MLETNGPKHPASLLHTATSMAKHREIQLGLLFKNVQRDYLDNNRKSKANVDYQVASHLGPFFGERSAERLTGALIEEYKDMRLAEGAKRSTINLELATLRRALSLGMLRGLINKAVKVTLFRVGNSNRRTGFFEQADFDRLMEHLLPYMKHLLRFAYVCGMREGELFKLRWDENYDENDNCIRIYTSKSGKGRTIPLLNDCALVIEERKLNRVKNCPYIFHYRGRPCNRNTFNKHWRAACKLAGVKRHFHDTRRTAVRNLTRSGVHRTIAKAITGHETDHVFERYDIIDTKDLIDAFRKVGEYVKKFNGGDDGNNTPQSSNNSSPPSSNVPPATSGVQGMAERVGFEPTGLFLDHTISSLVSTITSTPNVAENQDGILALKAECGVIVRSTNQVSSWISKIMAGLTKGKGE